MGPDQRPAPRGLSHLERLQANPKRFHLFHALRVIEAHYADAPRQGESRRPSQDRVRLGQMPELSFPETTIESFRPATDARPGQLMNLFFGPFGPNGPLPLHLTAYARDRRRNHRDRTFQDFSNLFTHRMMGLLYRAWSSAHPAPSFDREGTDAFADKVAAIAGYRGESFGQRDAMPDLTKRYFAAHLGGATKHADGLASMVEAVFRAPTQLRQFVGTWLELEPSDRWALGRPGGLGRALHLGERVWSRATKFALRIGPLSRADYARLLPGGPGFAQLRAMVRNYVGDAMEFDVVLVLKGDEVPAPVLGSGIALGHTIWIGERTTRADADDLHATG
ncbi:MAG: type VI secretion system baseplate subunit TssG [Pseudomonadota bacterium]